MPRPIGRAFHSAHISESPGTNEEYIIDDYGTALIGTDTIDLYKANRAAMRQWGVRHVDIAILEWGSEDESLKVLGPRCKHGYVRKMVAALEKKKGKLSHKLLLLPDRFDLKPVWKSTTPGPAGHLDEPPHFDLVQVTPHFHGA